MCFLWIVYLCLKNSLRCWRSIRKGATNFQSHCLHLHRLTPLRKFLLNTTIRMRYTYICCSSSILPWLWISQMYVKRGSKNSGFAYVPQSVTILHGLKNGPAAVPLVGASAFIHHVARKRKKRNQQRGDGSHNRETAEHRKTWYAPCSGAGAAWLGEQTKVTPSDLGLI